MLSKELENSLSLNVFFNNSSYVCIDKKEEFSIDDLLIIKELILPIKIEKFHPNRKKEFVLGRLAAYKAYLELTGKKLLTLESADDRSPIWPDDVVGSITHNDDFVCVCVSLKSNLRSIGIDIEEQGRTKIELSTHIRSVKDLLKHESFTDTELLTLIFSAKESLYKMLNPLVKKFFGFESAYISEINPIEQSFKIHLDTHLNDEFSIKAHSEFKGHYTTVGNSILTKLEIN